MNILERITQCDWKSMGSPDIPRWMNELVAEDKQTRFRAYNEMVNHHLAPPECAMCSCETADLLALVKRDTAFRLIPFLLELLEDKKVLDDTKHLILVLLTGLLNFSRAEICLLEADREGYHPFARRLYNAIYEGIHIYRQLANSNFHNISDSADSVLQSLEVFK